MTDRQSVFPLEYTKNMVTADGRFLLPDNTEAYQITSCGYQTSSEELMDERTYQRSLSVRSTTFSATYDIATSMTSVRPSVCLSVGLTLVDCATRSVSEHVTV